MNLLTAALALFTLAACTDQDENENPNGRTALQVTTAAITTRATDNAWEASDAIGITLLEAGTATPVDGKNACKYTTSTATGNFSPVDEENTAYFPTQGKSADVLAFYPYTAIGSDLLVPVNTASQASLSSIDLMTATPARGHSAVNPEVTLAFRHRLAKLTITVDKEASAADVDLAGATIEVVGTAATAQWSLTDEKLTNEASIADIAVPATTTKDAMSATAIVLPTAAGKDVKLIVTTADGTKSFTAPLDAATALMAGTEHFLNVHLKQTAATISVTIADWTTGKTLDLPSLVIETTATDGTTEGIHTLTLWSNANAIAKADYTFDAATSQWSSLTPFYLENLTEADTFFARHTPTTTDAVSSLTDVLGNTTAATQKDGGIALEMKHLMSKFNVSLTRGTGFPTTIDLSGVTLTLNGFKKTLALSDANVATATGTAAAYTTTTDASNAASLIVIPQALAVGTEFVVTLKNKATYTAKLAAALTLTAGNIHTLALTLDKSELSIALSVAPWTTSSSTQAVVIDGITAATAGTDDFKGAAGDVMELFYVPTSGANVTATYTSDGSKWTAGTALYWDAIALADYSTKFAASCTPKADGTPEKDYLEAGATVAYGSPINLTFTHVTAQLKIDLKAGTGFTDDADLISKTTSKKLTVQTSTAQTFAPAAVAPTSKWSFTLGAAAARDFVSGTTYTLAPQALTDASTIVLTIANGNTYTVKLKDIMTTSGGTTPVFANDKIAPAQSYTLTLTVNETGVGVNATVTPWTTISGSGDMGSDN